MTPSGRWQTVFKQLFDWGNQPTQADSSLIPDPVTGERICAVCPTTEDSKGYFLVLVKDAVLGGSHG